MAKHRVFYSFHYDNDAWRVQMVRNIGAIEGNEPASPNNWETIKKTGDAAIKKWIDDNMEYRSCVIVLVGSQTSERKYVSYEIIKAWNEGKALFGIFIHNLRDKYSRTSKKGNNPFSKFTIENTGGKRMSEFIPCYNPPENPNNAYNYIAENLSGWIDLALVERGIRAK